MKNHALVKNPLTVIAIFASLTEIVCGAVTPFVNDTNNQKLFLIFVIGFPILLVTLFFITLNFNHKVIYAPSDFNDTDNNIAHLFYGKEKNNAISEKPSNLLIKENSLNKENIAEMEESIRPFYYYALDFFENVEKILPLDKMEEINFDSENNVIHTLEIRIKNEFLKENEKKRDVFVLYVNHEFEYNEEKGEYSREKITFGLIAGSGYGISKANSHSLALYVSKSILERLK